MMRWILLAASLLAICCGIEFKINLQTSEEYCFYEILGINQKYSFVVNPTQEASFEASVRVREGNDWTQLFSKLTKTKPFKARADKISTTDSPHMFCIKNYASYPATYAVLLNTGIELLELHELPNQSDADNLERQIDWIRNQTTVLDDRYQNISALQTANRLSTDMLGVKMIILAVIGLVLITLVNLVFFRFFKNALKEKKMI